MRATVHVHTKSGKSLAFTLERGQANDIAVRYSDWLTVGDETDAPIIDIADAQGNRRLIHFSNVEFIEIEAL